MKRVFDFRHEPFLTRFGVLKIARCFVFFFALLLPCHLWAQTAGIEVLHSSDTYHPGRGYPVLFKITIQDGWYLHGTGTQPEGIIPTALTFSDTPGLTVQEMQFPAPLEKKVDYLPDPIDLFSGEILVRATIEFEKEFRPGSLDLRGTLSYQACSGTMCIAPETIPVTAVFPLTPEETPTRTLNAELFSPSATDRAAGKKTGAFGEGKGLPLTLALIFFGGLALNLSPCIYPMIPISVSYFGGKSGQMKGAVVLHGLFYLIGLSVTNSALGVFSALSGNMMGAALQHPAALIAIALIMAGLAFSFFDIWEFRMPSALNAVAAKNYSGYFGTFFMGLTLGIIAAPCIGPFVLGLVTYVGQRGDPLFGFLCFFILSIGMGLPLCILALFSGALKKLPVSGDWMLWIRKLMGWVLMAMAAYMLRPLLSGPALKSALFLVVSLAAGLHLGFFDRSGGKNPRFSRLKRSVGVAVILLGVLPLSTAFTKTDGIAWQSYDNELLAAAARERKPVILDFYADWCLPCRGLDRTVFNDPEVAALSGEFAVLRLDLTTHQAFQDEILQKYNVVGVPTVVFLNGRGEEETDIRVASEVSKSDFLEAMNRALNSKS